MLTVPITEYRRIFNKVFKEYLPNNGEEEGMVKLDKVDIEEQRRKKLKALYEDYEKKVMTIVECRHELDDMLKTLTKEYEEAYLKEAGLR